LLLGGPATRTRGGFAGEAAFAAAAYASPARLAECLADVAMQGEPTFYAGVAALRFDDFDVGAELDRLIDAYDDHAADIGAFVTSWAHRHRVLPVYFDMGGVSGFQRDGTLLAIGWDEAVDRASVEPYPPFHLGTLSRATQRYPSLRTLGPARPHGAVPCQRCNGSGLSPGKRSGCVFCWCLGWEIPEAPSWFHDRDDFRKNSGSP
jgi:hypothetical protein